MRIFKVFGTSEGKTSSDTITPPRNNSHLNYCRNSNESYNFRKSKISNILSYQDFISPFNPVLEMTEEPRTLTDRYIPSRKLLKRDPLFQ